MANYKKNNLKSIFKDIGKALTMTLGVLAFVALLPVVLAILVVMGPLALLAKSVMYVTSHLIQAKPTLVKEEQDKIDAFFAKNPNFKLLSELAEKDPSLKSEPIFTSFKKNLEQLVTLKEALGHTKNLYEFNKVKDKAKDTHYNLIFELIPAWRIFPNAAPENQLKLYETYLAIIEPLLENVFSPTMALFIQKAKAKRDELIITENAKLLATKAPYSIERDPFNFLLKRQKELEQSLKKISNELYIQPKTELGKEISKHAKQMITELAQAITEKNLPLAQEKLKIANIALQQIQAQIIPINRDNNPKFKP